MAGVEARDFESPDETRTPDKTQVDVVRIGGPTAARLATITATPKTAAGRPSRARPGQADGLPMLALALGGERRDPARTAPP